MNETSGGNTFNSNTNNAKEILTLPGYAIRGTVPRFLTTHKGNNNNNNNNNIINNMDNALGIQESPNKNTTLPIVGQHNGNSKNKETTKQPSIADKSIASHMGQTYGDIIISVEQPTNQRENDSNNSKKNNKKQKQNAKTTLKNSHKRHELEHYGANRQDVINTFLTYKNFFFRNKIFCFFLLCFMCILIAFIYTVVSIGDMLNTLEGDDNKKEIKDFEKSHNILHSNNIEIKTINTLETSELLNAKKIDDNINENSNNHDKKQNNEYKFFNEKSIHNLKEKDTKSKINLGRKQEDSHDILINDENKKNVDKSKKILGKKQTIMKSLDLKKNILYQKSINKNDKNEYFENIQIKNVHIILNENGDAIIEYDILEYFGYDFSNSNLISYHYECCCVTDMMYFCGNENIFMKEFSYDLSYAILKDKSNKFTNTNDIETASNIYDLKKTKEKWKFVLYINEELVNSEVLNCHFIATLFVYE